MEREHKAALLLPARLSAEVLSFYALEKQRQEKEKMLESEMKGSKSISV